MKERLKNLLKKIGSAFGALFKKLSFGKLKGKMTWRWIIVGIVILFLFFFVISLYMGRAPSRFDLGSAVSKKVGSELVTGTATTATMIILAEKMLNKPGGYLSNDILPPSVFMDDIPNWEFGVLVQIRDMAYSLRNDFSRSRSQSLEDKDLSEAQPAFNHDSKRWLVPSAQTRYRFAIKMSEQYLNRLKDPGQEDAQFYARADNLADWLAVVEKRLGSLSHRLSASVGQVRDNTDLAGDAAAEQSTTASTQVTVKTPWLQLDDVFFEARGYTWSLLHFLEAIELDFDKVLEKKNAKAMVRQIIRELEGTQRSVWSPLILNGGGFGLTANHSLVMASYISRANAAVLDLRNLLKQG